MLTPTAILTLLGFVVLFGALSRPLSDSWISAPMVFTGFGLAVGDLGLGLVSFEPTDGTLHALAELTLVVVLFTDASRIDLRHLRQRWSLPARLLGLGMPLSILLGTGAGLLLFPQLGLWEVAALAAILAPTDAALGQAVVSAEEVPEPVREALTVEGGLNDGIAVPIILVFLALAGAAHSEHSGAGGWLTFWIQQVTLGPLGGVVIGGGGGALLSLAAARGFTLPAFERLAGLALAALCFFGADHIGGNGLIAAFVGGAVFGRTAPNVSHHVHTFMETEGQLLMMMVFVLLGCALAGPALLELRWQTVIYALLSLTLVRMIPVALAALGCARPFAQVMFMGWFGPRGLASLLFGLLLLEHETLTDADPMFQIVVFTVLASVALHGVTARVGVRALGRSNAKTLANTTGRA